MEPSLPYTDRVAAGRVLARELGHLAGEPGLLVLGLPRGGVPVAAVVARELGAELDVMIVRKLGVPGHEEYAFGAIAGPRLYWLNGKVVDDLGLSKQAIAAVMERQIRRIEHDVRLYRGDNPSPNIEGKCVILVDDGVATGATIKLAIKIARSAHPRRLVVAVPLAPAQTLRELSTEADEVICPAIPSPFYAVSQGYEDFQQVSDEEVQSLLAEHPRRLTGAAPESGRR